MPEQKARTESDEVIYSRWLRNRREDDLRELLLRHGESLTLFLFTYVHSMEDAEELMMDAFASVAAGRTAFSGRSSFRTWLFAVGRNLARMHLRKHTVKTVPLDDVKFEFPAGADDPRASLLRDERNRELYKAMQGLDSGHRNILYLLYFEGMNYEEIAHVVGRSRKQVYKLADRCRAELRKELERMGFDPADD